MRVVSTMAAIAGTGLSDLGHILGLVAGVAVKPLMGTVQRKSRLPCVIELPTFPAVRIVA